MRKFLFSSVHPALQWRDESNVNLIYDFVPQKNKFQPFLVFLIQVSFILYITSVEQHSVYVAPAVHRQPGEAIAVYNWVFPKLLVVLFSGSLLNLIDPRQEKSVISTSG